MPSKRQTQNTQTGRAGEKRKNNPRRWPIERADMKIAYRRTRDLPKLIALWPRELGDGSPAGREKILAKLREALRAERMRGRAGHWAYDLARHAQLLAAYKAENDERDAESRVAYATLVRPADRRRV